MFHHNIDTIRYIVSHNLSLIGELVATSAGEYWGSSDLIFYYYTYIKHKLLKKPFLLTETVFSRYIYSASDKCGLFTGRELN